MMTEPSPSQTQDSTEPSQSRICHICGETCDSWCPTCTANFESRRDAEAMTGDERAAELELLFGPLEIKFDLLHKRIEELVGRSVWTHEMGLNHLGLVEEARTRKAATLQEVMDLIPPEKRIVVVVNEGDAS